jgi:hypothetical protein
MALSQSLDGYYPAHLIFSEIEILLLLFTCYP